MKIRKKHEKMTDEEFEAVVQELAERCKDMVYMNSEERIRERIKDDDLLNLSSGTEYTITYNINFVAGDIQQLVARMRRIKDEPKREISKG